MINSIKHFEEHCITNFEKLEDLVSAGRCLSCDRGKENFASFFSI